MAAPLDRAGFLELHRRLCLREQCVGEDLTRRILFWMFKATARHFPKRYADPVYDGVSNAWLKFRAHPEAFAPHGKASLETFLLKLAYRQAQDFIRHERRVAKRQRKWAKKNPEIRVADEPSAACISIEDQIRDMKALNEVLTALNDKDRPFYELYLSGRGSMQEFAVRLGTEDCSEDEQRREFKRNLDRIRKFLKRQCLFP